MLPSDHLTWKENPIKGDTRKFVAEVLLALLNILRSEGVDTRDVELLGTNDVYVFRGEKLAILVLSRSAVMARPIHSEFPLADVFGQERDIETARSALLEDPTLAADLTARGCHSPVVAVFPADHLALQGEELERAAENVAELLVEPAKEDVDRKRRIVRVIPVFQGREFLLEPDLCFVLMEFKTPYKEIYEHLIRPTVEDEGMRCVKSDDIFATTSVIEDIWANINKAALIIGEISGNNPNVMYELGICHTVGKNVMMITQKPDDIPFNFRHMRCYPYTNDIPGSDELKRNIRGVIKHLKAGHESA